jgi:hypothetical protein
VDGDDIARLSAIRRGRDAVLRQTGRRLRPGGVRVRRAAKLPWCGLPATTLLKAGIEVRYGAADAIEEKARAMQQQFLRGIGFARALATN